jgi:hypothetical protein
VSKFLEGLNTKQSSKDGDNAQPQETSANNLPFEESQLILDGSKDISAILPQRLVHIQPILEEECRIDEV